jgi:ABC-type multidrug transport system fused ATPase/permease subunit
MRMCARSAAVIVFSLGRNLSWFDFALNAGTRLNSAMLARVLRAPLSFFHTNPTGRILNVFAKDRGSVDEQLPAVMFDAVQTISTTLGAMIVIAIANPTVIPIFLPLVAMFMYYRGYYLTSSREVKRFEAVTRSPVYAAFSATIKGLPTIRAFRASGRFRKEFLDALNVNGSWWIAFLGTSRCASQHPTAFCSPVGLLLPSRQPPVPPRLLS